MLGKRIVISAFSLMSIPLVYALVAPAFSIQRKGGRETCTARNVYSPRGDVLLIFPEESPTDKMIIQVSVPEFEQKETRANGETFQQIRMKGYGFTSETGKPRLPVKGLLLAVPEGAQLQVRVLRSEKVAKSSDKVYPVPEMGVDETDDGASNTVEKFVLDRAAYSSDHRYPENLAEVGLYGYLRDVRVAQIKLFPLQYDPARGELVHHKKIWLEVRLLGGSFPSMDESPGGFAGKDNPFESIYRNTIINYSPDLARTGARLGRTGGLERDVAYLDNNPLKMSVEEDGVYTVGYQDLYDAGVNLAAVDPRTIKVFNLGEEISVSVTGEEDGIFDVTDRVEFFGQGNKGEFSFSNIYWLSWGGNDGSRMEQKDCGPGDSLPVPATFAETLHFEEDKRYYSDVFDGEGRDHWFWQQLNAPVTQAYNITLPGVSGGFTDARITVNLRGKNSTSHSVQAYLNGNPAADCTWYGMTEYESDFFFPQTYLSSGDNELTVECNSTGSQFFLNWFDIEYRRNYEANEGWLRFFDSEPGPNQFEVSGFENGEVALFRITEATQPVRMTGHHVVPAGSNHKLIFEDDLSQEEYYAVTPGAKKTPSSIVRDEASELRSPYGGADYIIITHEDYYDGVQPLKDLREAEGLRVEVVKVEEVYDEFSFGNFDPRAIRDFLEYTYYDWPPPAPSYVLLVGDASYDYKGNLTGANTNYVPTHLFTTQTTVESSTDDWFVYLVGDDLLPDMLIGRLTAQTTADLDAQIEKIINYETAIPSGDWREKFLLIADIPDEGGDFEAVADNFADNYITPAGFEVSKCYVNDCHPICRQRVMGAINEGRVVCNFIGHGSIDSWSKRLIFQSPDVAYLYNGGKQPFVVTMDCLNGFFHHATDDYCIAEELVRARNKGAVACLSHSGLDYTSTSETIGCFLYDALLNDGDFILGSAVYRAKTGYLGTSPYYWDQAVMLILFGDPALELGFPGKPDVLPGLISFDPLRPVAGTPDTMTAVIFNAGREDASDVSVRFSWGHPDSSVALVLADVTIPYLKAGGRSDAVAVWDSVPDPGSYAIFIQVDRDDRIAESNEWNNTSWDSIRVLSPDVPQDTIPPTVELYVENEKVGAGFESDCYVSPSPEIEAVFVDDWSGIDTRDISLTLNGKPIENFELDHDEVGSNVVKLSYNPSSLRNGRYTLAVKLADCAANPNSASCSATFRVESSFKLMNVRNYPNPSWGNTKFVYTLSRNADDVTIKIYSVTGQLLKTIPGGAGRRNANVLAWDGRDLNGNNVASGVYLYKVLARRQGDHVQTTGKMVVVR